MKEALINDEKELLIFFSVLISHAKLLKNKINRGSQLILLAGIWSTLDNQQLIKTILMFYSKSLFILYFSEIQNKKPNYYLCNNNIFLSIFIIILLMLYKNQIHIFMDGVKWMLMYYKVSFRCVFFSFYRCNQQTNSEHSRKKHRKQEIIWTAVKCQIWYEIILKLNYKDNGVLRIVLLDHGIHLSHSTNNFNKRI